MHKRHFLNWKNFQNPYHGVTQTLVQRSLSTGLYFPLEDIFIHLLSSRMKDFSLTDNRVHILSGNFAGLINGLFLNPLSYIKYQCWGRNNASFFNQATQMYLNGGPTVFFRGTVATCFRDAIFGASYAFLRNFQFYPASASVSSDKSIFQDMAAAGIGTILSSPLNYIRNIQFHRHSAKQCPTMRIVILKLGFELYREKTYFKRLKMLQHRFRIGWGTLRVAVGMGLGAKLYSLCLISTNNADLSSLDN